MLWESCLQISVQDSIVVHNDTEVADLQHHLQAASVVI